MLIAKFVAFGETLYEYSSEPEICFMKIYKPVEGRYYRMMMTMTMMMTTTMMMLTTTVVTVMVTT